VIWCGRAALKSICYIHLIIILFAINLGTPTGERKDEEEMERFYSAEESPLGSSEEKDYRDDKTKQANSERRQREKRGSVAYKTGRSRGGGRGGRGGRGGTNGTFLADRQQLGERDKHRKGGEEKALSAADKNIGNKFNSSQNSTQGTANTNTTANLEEISMHSPPKRSKTNPNEKREEKKRDISREFDLNNIRSVVIIDDMPSSRDQQPGGEKVVEDDFADFVTVKSKKQQREQRDRAREEEKKKLKIEQKKEATLANNKLQKERQTSNRNNRSEATQPKEQQQQQPQMNQPTKVTKSATEIPSPAPSTEHNNPATLTTNTATTATVVLIPPVTPSALASNAAMAAIGGWEPAQSLMRTSQHAVIPEQNKPIVTNVNAWQRPLSLTTVSSAPDPRAVGTGKPSSSQANSIKVKTIPSLNSLS